MPPTPRSSVEEVGVVEVFMGLTVNLAMMARSRLDADQPHADKGFGAGPLDLTMVARLTIPSLNTERTSP